MTIHKFVLNGSVFESPQSQLTLGQIRALTATPADCELVLEGQGEAPDRVLAEGEVVDLSIQAVAIYFRPPTMFGGACGDNT
jgi:hypothetical protein